MLNNDLYINAWLYIREIAVSRSRIIEIQILRIWSFEGFWDFSVQKKVSWSGQAMSCTNTWNILFSEQHVLLDDRL